MISAASIWAIILRHIRLFRHDLNALLYGFYWPLLDVLTWGFLGIWIQQSAHFENYETIALLGLLLFQIVGRGCNFINLALCEELWSRNIVNLFSLPLRMSEWICSIILLYMIMTAITSLACVLVISMFYDIAMWHFLATLLRFTPPLLFSGIWLGFTGLQITVTLGRRGAELANVLTWFFLPFTGAYYPIEVLPSWGQRIGACLPMSYVFEGMRKYMIHQQDPTPYLIKGYMLGIPYALSAIILFVYCFNRSKQKGLARLTD